MKSPELVGSTPYTELELQGLDSHCLGKKLNDKEAKIYVEQLIDLLEFDSKKILCLINSSTS